MIKKTSTTWGGVAEWYDNLLEGGDTFQAKVIAPNLVRLLGDVKGKKFFDIACGEGYFSRIFSKEGALVTGVDISKELIKKAQEKGGGAKYFASSADELTILKNESFDVAICILAIQNIEKYQKILEEASRVLVKGGVLHLVLNHPAFRVPKESAWGFDDEKKVQFRRVDRYLSELKNEIEMHPGQVGGEKTVSFHRPLQSYFKAFEKSGFVAGRLEEWVSHKTSDSGPRAQAENRARAEFPIFLYLSVQKI